jgi:hypothetical protein
MSNTTSPLRSDLVAAICQVISSIGDTEDDPDDKQLDMVVDLLRALFYEYYRLGRPIQFPPRH